MGVGIIPVGRTDAEVDAELDALPSRYVAQGTGAALRPSDPFTAAPSGDLVWETSSLTFRPTSIGTDGLLYGAYGALYNARTTNGTSDTAGYNFASTAEHTGGVGVVMWSTRTQAGYVVITTKTGKAYVWFSTSFNSGFSKVLEIDWLLIESLGIPQPARTKDGSSVLFLGVWGSGGTAKPLHASFDGGQNWTKVKDTVVVNAGVNSHWHTACYHADTDTIWASAGDGDNAWFGYSQDRGATWWPSTTPTTSEIYDGKTYQQPAVMVPFADRISLGPDRGDFHPGIWTMDPFTGRTVETFSIDDTISDAHLQYPIYPIAHRGNEAYVCFTDTGSANDKTMIAATGDGGRSWHKVSEFAWGGLAWGKVGIVGPDQFGYLYMKRGIGGGSAGTVYRAPALTWLY